MSGIESSETLPVIELFADKTRCEIITYALTEMPTDEWVQYGTIVDNTTVGRESVRLNIDVVVAFGVLDVKNQDAPIRHYQLADTPVVDMLQSWSGFDLTELFAYSGRKKLVDFLLTRADPDESYSQNAIARNSAAGNTSVSDHIDTVVASGLAREVEGSRGTEYQPARDSEIYDFLAELNEVLYKTYQERMPID